MWCHAQLHCYKYNVHEFETSSGVILCDRYLSQPAAFGDGEIVAQVAPRRGSAQVAYQINEKRPRDFFMVETLLLSQIKTSNEDIHVLQHWNTATTEQLLAVRRAGACFQHSCP